jgi:Holliday junction resolvase RusA-like endonuclease
MTSDPCRVEVVFFLPRPKSVKREYPSVAPDLDKLLRGLFDACTAAKVWGDDSQAVDVIATKRYSDAPGCSVSITVL